MQRYGFFSYHPNVFKRKWEKSNGFPVIWQNWRERCMVHIIFIYAREGKLSMVLFSWGAGFPLVMLYCDWYMAATKARRLYAITRYDDICGYVCVHSPAAMDKNWNTDGFILTVMEKGRFWARHKKEMCPGGATCLPMLGNVLAPLGQGACPKTGQNKT